MKSSIKGVMKNRSGTKIKLFLTALCIFTGAGALAQTESISIKRSEVEDNQTSGKNLISTDGFAVLVGGAGIAYDRIISDSASLGLFGTAYNLHTKASKDDSMNLQSVGFRSRIFLRETAMRSGWYFSAGMVNVKLKTSVRSDTTNIEGKAQDSRTGLLGSFGYQLSGRALSAGKMQMNLAVLGGTGLGAQYSATASSTSTEVNTQIRDGLGLEASLGFLF
jgi:hypothetical protein